MPKERDYRLDLLKIVFCILIIALHTPMGLSMKAYLPVCGLTALAVPGFFAISGYLLFFREHDTKKIYTKVLPRYICIFLFWGMVHWIQTWTAGHRDWERFIPFVFKNSEAWHLWYLKCLIEFLICYPFLKAIVDNKKLLKLYSILWFVLVAVRFVFLHSLGIPWNFLRWMQIPLFDLDVFIDGTIGAYYPTVMMGLVLVGGAFIDHVKKAEQPKAWNRWFIAAMIFGYAFTMALGIYQRYVDYDETTYGIANPLNAYIVVEVFGLIGLVLANCHISEKSAKLISYVSSLTLGVYVVHPLILKLVMKLYDYWKRADDVLLFVIVTILSFVIVGILRWILPKRLRGWII